MTAIQAAAGEMPRAKPKTRCDQVVKRLGSKGVRFRGPIVRDENAGIALAFFGDQDGNDLYICQMTSSQ